MVEIEKKRKESITVDSGDTKELLKSVTKNLPVNSELMKLIDQTFKIDQKKEQSEKKDKETVKKKEEKEPFKPQRFPSILSLNPKMKGESRRITFLYTEKKQSDLIPMSKTIILIG